jgi:cytochrome c-type biogenesis protein CcmH
MRRLGARLAVAALLAAGVATGPPAAARAAASATTSLPVIERQVMCVTCKIPLNVAQSTQADRERAYIRGLIAGGDDEAQVKQALVAQYGQNVLGSPPSSGFDLTVYLVPVAVVAVLVLLLALLLPRWRRRQPATGVASTGASPAALSASERARLDADIARYD